MSNSSQNAFLNRFSRLEIPEEKRRRDLGFLETPLALPAPAPYAGEALLVLVNGRALAPRDAPAAPRRSIRFYGEAHALEELEPPDAVEAAYRGTEAVAREAKRFLDAVPTAALRDPSLVAEAVELLEADGRAAGGARAGAASLPEAAKALAAAQAGDLAPLAGASLFTSRLVGFARLLRIHGKLYDLVTLREYVAVFEKAIDPAFFRKLAALPLEVSPEELLREVEGALDKVHAKARSPLRNKLDTGRVVVNGVTLLPLYREPAAGLFESYGRLLERSVKALALARHAGR